MILNYLLEYFKNLSKNKTTEINIENKTDSWSITLKEEESFSSQEKDSSLNMEEKTSILLAPGKRIVADIYKEVLKSKCEEIPCDSFTHEQIFSYENKCYIIKDINLFNEIEYIKSQRGTEEVYNKIINSRKTQPLKGLEKIIVENIEKLTHPLVSQLIKQTDELTIAKLIINVLNIFLRKRIQKKEDKFEFQQQAIGTTLVEVILEACMHSMYLYYNTKTFNEDPNTTPDKNHVHEFSLRDNTSLKSLFYTLTKKNYEEFDVAYLERKHNFILPNKYFFDLLIQHLELYCIQKSIIGINLPKRNALQISLNKIELDLGIEICYFLKELNIVEFTKDNKNVPYIKIVGKYELDCFTSNNFFKPKLHLDEKSRAAVFDSEKQFKLNIMRNEKQIPNKKYCHVSPEKELFDLLETYDEVKYECNPIGLFGLIELIQIIMKTKDFTKNRVLLDSIFNAEIEMLCKNNNNLILVQELLEYIQDFTLIFSRDLRDSTENNLGCKALLNKTNAYKLMLNNIITDLFVLSHFNYFHLSHYVTASGRCLTMSNAVQLQGLKLVKGLIQFKAQPFINEKEFNDFNAFLKKTFPDIPINIEYHPKTSRKV